MNHTKLAIPSTSTLWAQNERTLPRLPVMPVKKFWGSPNLRQVWLSFWAHELNAYNTWKKHNSQCHTFLLSQGCQLSGLFNQGHPVEIIPPEDLLLQPRRMQWKRNIAASITETDKLPLVALWSQFTHCLGTSSNRMAFSCGSSCSITVATGKVASKSKLNCTPAGGFLKKFLLSWEEHEKR